jgi:glycosyltransferase involved in cell wall biosynthesis
MAKITIVTPTYNEEENVLELYTQLQAIFATLPEHTFTHLFIDNASTDRTQELIRSLTLQDSSVRAIFNTRNFGHIRSPVYGLLQGSGDAVILMASDLQDPPELIPDFLRHWKAGNKVVMAVKNDSEESALFFFARKCFYNLIARISDIKLIKNFTGTGLYDRCVLDVIRDIDDPYPYFRGLIAELGFKTAIVNFKQPLRKRGFTKNNFYTLYDMAMLGIINHSRVPLRLATLSGFVLSGLSLFLAFAYLLAKLFFWNLFPAGIAPLLIAVFFFSAIQLFFIGVIGEYIGTILTQVQKRPMVIEKERLNFFESSARQARPSESQFLT